MADACNLLSFCTLATAKSERFGGRSARVSANFDPLPDKADKGTVCVFRRLSAVLTRPYAPVILNGAFIGFVKKGKARISEL